MHGLILIAWIVIIRNPRYYGCLPLDKPTYLLQLLHCFCVASRDCGTSAGGKNAKFGVLKLPSLQNKARFYVHDTFQMLALSAPYLIYLSISKLAGYLALLVVLTCDGSCSLHSSQYKASSLLFALLGMEFSAFFFEALEGNMLVDRIAVSKPKQQTESNPQKFNISSLAAIWSVFDLFPITLPSKQSHQSVF
jgi:hypothetical protein